MFLTFAHAMYRPLPGDMDLLDHKRARLEEPDRRVQSEWQRLKEYEEELRQKEMMLRAREREAMIAAAGPLPMVNGWAQPDPSRSALKHISTHLSSVQLSTHSSA